MPAYAPGAHRTRAARTFAASPYLSASTGFGLAANDPWFVTLFIKRETTGTGMVVQLGLSGSNAQSRYLYNPAATTVGVYTQGASSSSAISAATFVAGQTWYPLIGEWASTASRRVILAGAVVSDTATQSLSSAPSLFRIGAQMNAGLPSNISVQAVGVFAGAASDELIAAHARGIHPKRLPGQLLECWDLDRIGPITGLVSGTVLAPTNGGTLTAGPPIQGPPTPRRFFFGPTAGVSAGARLRRLLLCGSR